MSDNNESLKLLQQALQESKAGWQAGETSISILTEEQQQLRLGYNPGPGEPSLQEREALAIKNLQGWLSSKKLTTPAAFDWRNVNGRNFINSVKDQGSCGSCVSFGVTATIEGTARVVVNLAVSDPGGAALPDLSEAQLFYCGGGSCGNGWWVDPAMNYSKVNGIAPESFFPYTPGDQPCAPGPGWQQAVTKIGASHNINTIADMKSWLSTRGPLAVCFSVYADFFNYKSGVYTHVSGAFQGGHCVSCIGYDDNLQAWLCRNSWGTGWGMSGFFWIGYGQCGIDALMTAVDSFDSIYPLYNDLFLRANLNDSGAIPAAGPLSTSPDIIPYGNAPVTDPQDFFSANYGSDVGKDLIANTANYLYMRVKNLNAGNVNGNLSLYYSKASLLLYPSLWKENILSTSDGNTSVPIQSAASGIVTVGTDPFTWSPQMIQGDHYCLIGRVVTPAHPNPVPDTGSIQDFAAYISNNRAMGWRNVTVVDNGSPTFSTSVDYMQGTQASTMLILLTTTNIPIGAEVGFSCGTPGPQPIINLPKSKVTDPSSFIIGISSLVPAGWESSITYSYWANGTTPLPGWSIGLKIVYLVEADNPLFNFGYSFDELGLDEKEYRSTLRDNIGIQPVKGIIVGGHMTKGDE